MVTFCLEKPVCINCAACMSGQGGRSKNKQNKKCCEILLLTVLHNL